MACLLLRDVRPLGGASADVLVLEGVIAAVGHGLSADPGTPVEAVSELRGLADLVLCMTVNPGWGGQSFIPGSPDKVERLKPLVGDAVIEVDGGIDTTTAGGIAAAGASLFVAGSAVFGADDPAAAYQGIAEAAGAA